MALTTPFCIVCEHKQTKPLSFLAHIATFSHVWLCNCLSCARGQPEVHGRSMRRLTYKHCAVLQAESAWTWPLLTPSFSSTATSTLRTTCRPPPGAIALVRAGGYQCVCVRCGVITTLLNSAKEVIAFFSPFPSVVCRCGFTTCTEKVSMKVCKKSDTFNTKIVQPDRCGA